MAREGPSGQRASIQLVRQVSLAHAGLVLTLAAVLAGPARPIQGHTDARSALHMQTTTCRYMQSLHCVQGHTDARSALNTDLHMRIHAELS